MGQNELQTGLSPWGKVSGPKEFLTWLDAKKLIPQGERYSRFRTLDLSLRMFGSPVTKDASNFILGDAGDQLASLNLAQPDPVFVLASQILTAVSVRNKRPEEGDFFRGSDPSEGRVKATISCTGIRPRAATS
ncbi:hypothetical protein [Bradyrhizobium manausense]|uniref:hypothetical protein n=1 Tax=Bradyrhizobium manausense TaxID=989370 RepID=UPI0012EE5C47|nr:hypothetical protein [Bradyrhizobium manausense]